MAPRGEWSRWLSLPHRLHEVNRRVAGHVGPEKLSAPLPRAFAEPCAAWSDAGAARTVWAAPVALPIRPRKIKDKGASDGKLEIEALLGQGVREDKADGAQMEAVCPSGPILDIADNRVARFAEMDANLVLSS